MITTPDSVPDPNARGVVVLAGESHGERPSAVEGEVGAVPGVAVDLDLWWKEIISKWLAGKWSSFESTFVETELDVSVATMESVRGRLGRQSTPRRPAWGRVQSSRTW